MDAWDEFENVFMSCFIPRERESFTPCHIMHVGHALSYPPDPMLS